MKNIIFYFLSILTFISCKNIDNAKNDLNNVAQIVVNSNNAFESTKAEKLNQEAIDYCKNGNTEKANELLLEALKIEPKNPTLYNNLGLIESHQKNHKKSISYFQKIIIIFGLNIFIYCSKFKFRIL